MLPVAVRGGIILLVLAITAIGSAALLLIGVGRAWVMPHVIPAK